jgi:hypothetical protein
MRSNSSAIRVQGTAWTPRALGSGPGALGRITALPTVGRTRIDRLDHLVLTVTDVDPTVAF